MARSTTIRSGGVTIDTSGLRELATALRKTEAKAYKDYRKALRAAGEITAERARSIAAENSTSIPPTVKVRVAGAQVSITGGSKSVPLGGLYELGNTGGAKSAAASRSGTFRHPVFGDRDVWVDQPMHRYLWPAYMETRPATLTAIDGVFIEAFRSSGIEAT